MQYRLCVIVGLFGWSFADNANDSCRTTIGVVIDSPLQLTGLAAEQGQKRLKISDREP